MFSKNTLGAFRWGTAEQLRAELVADIPCFDLVNPAGDLPFANRPVAAPGGAEERRALVRNGRTVGVVWSDAHADWCFLAGVGPADPAAPRGAQAASVFLELEALLAEAGMTFAHVVRTWLYIDRVCEWYGEFNAARSAFFESRKVFDTFLPASTGIGTANLAGTALVSGLIAMKPKHAGARAEIVESPLQAPAMAYKSSFSRAAEIILPARRRLFVSGTASIEPDSHEVAFVGDIEKQIDCTMKAVHAILASRGYDWPDVPRAVVYLKHPEFLAPWRTWCARSGFPLAAVAETVCDVCRDEWLFEIECDAVK